MQRQKQKQHTDSLMRSVQQFTKRSTFSPDSSCFPPGSCTPSQSRTSWTAAQGLCGNGGDDHDQENDDDDRKSEGKKIKPDSFLAILECFSNFCFSGGAPLLAPVKIFR